jgi:hypothetical protein
MYIFRIFAKQTSLRVTEVTEVTKSYVIRYSSEKIIICDLKNSAACNVKLMCKIFFSY